MYALPVPKLTTERQLWQDQQIYVLRIRFTQDRICTIKIVVDVANLRCELFATSAREHGARSRRGKGIPEDTQSSSSRLLIIHNDETYSEEMTFQR